MPTPTRYPLSWPAGYPRTKPEARRPARFSGTSKTNARRPLTVPEAVGRVTAELDCYSDRVRYVVLSSNVPTRGDGLPSGGQREPVDPGAAIYFQLDGRPYCLPCDTYTRLADNLAAIAATLEAGRVIERHGVLNTHNVYADFKALPEQASASTGATWWEILGVASTAGADEINAAFRELAKHAHPDQPGGSHERMQQLTEARRLGRNVPA